MHNDFRYYVYNNNYKIDSYMVSFNFCIYYIIIIIIIIIRLNSSLLLFESKCINSRRVNIDKE